MKIVKNPVLVYLYHVDVPGTVVPYQVLAYTVVPYCTVLDHVGREIPVREIAHCTRIRKGCAPRTLVVRTAEKVVQFYVPAH